MAAERHAGKRRRRRGSVRVGALALLALSLAGASGCALVAFTATSIDRATPKEVDAQYRGLAGKNFAVVATTDRMIEADFPGVIPKVIGDLSERLANDKNGVEASGYVPADRVMAYLYSHPNWVARQMSDVAKELGVERLIFVEVTEYRLNEPGNSFLWDGVAAGTVQVYETDSLLRDDPAFNRLVQVTFPDDSNVGETDMKGNVVGSELARRFIERAAWMFYDHEEAKDLTY